MDTVIATVNEIILQEAAAGRQLGSVRLHKLLYYVQVYSILDGEPAFPESFEAWQKGPMLRAFRDWVKGKGNFDYQHPFSDARVTSAALRGVIAAVLLNYGALATPEIILTSHNDILYNRTFVPSAPKANKVIDMNQTDKAYTNIHADEPLVATPLYVPATPLQEETILRLNHLNQNDVLLEQLIEENFPLVTSLIVTHRNVLTERAMADVVSAVADHWWASPVQVYDILRVALHSESGMVQEQALKGLINLADATWDDDVSLSSDEFTALLGRVNIALSDDRLTTLQPYLRPYLDVVHRNLLLHV